MSKDEIAELVLRIHESGVLGRSSTYPRLLDYLVEKTSSGGICSEVDLAEKVFFKSSTFDQTSDSSVRVYIHNLRKKLHAYYEGDGSKERLRVHIPKGEYRVEILDEENYAKVLEGKSLKVQTPIESRHESSLHQMRYGLWGGMAVLCGFIVIIGGFFQFSKQTEQIEYSDEQYAFWGGVLSDNKPVRILLDNATGRFGIQSLTISSVTSEDDSSDSQSNQKAAIPDLLIRLVDMLDGSDRPIEISYLAEFSPEDITGESHIVYTDHIDGIVKLAEIFDSVEQLEPTSFVSNLLSRQADILRSSDLSAGDPRATDYGMIFGERLQLPNSEEFELIVLAGNGFTGQSAVLQIAQSKGVLTEMQLMESEASSSGISALFQVTVSGGFLPERILLSSETH